MKGQNRHMEVVVFDFWIMKKYNGIQETSPESEVFIQLDRLESMK